MPIEIAFLILGWGLLGTIIVRAITSERPTENSMQKKPGADDEGGEGQDGVPNSPSSDFSALINAIRAEGTAYRAEQNREDKGKRFRDYLTLGALILTAGGVYWQVSEMIKVYEPVQKQAQAAIDQSKIAIAAQRPWVGMDGVVAIDVLQLKPSLVVEAHYKVKNFGNGTARKVVTSGWFIEQQPSLAVERRAADFACDSAERFSTGTLPTGPNVTNPGPFGFVLFPSQSHDEFIGSPRDPWTGRALQESNHFKFIGCTAYIDQFNNLHWTRFCMELAIEERAPYTKDTKLAFCSLYNDTDEDQEEKKSDQRAPR